MTKFSSSLTLERKLILVDAKIVGPTGDRNARLVVDTGAAATTLIPEVIHKVGYTEVDGYKKATVHTAVGEEEGYWLRVAELNVLGVTIPDFALAVFSLGVRISTAWWE